MPIDNSSLLFIHVRFTRRKEIEVHSSLFKYTLTTTLLLPPLLDRAHCEQVLKRISSPTSHVANIHAPMLPNSSALSISPA